MRIYEVVDNQLDEAYLAEVDWSKIKKGVATGVISLGLLGLSGLGNAAEITKMSDADVRAYVTQQLKKGNIDKSRVVKAVQKVDSVPAKSNPTKVDEPKPEVKKDEPKVQKDDVAEKRIKELEAKIKELENKNTASSDAKVKDLEAKIEKLEKTQQQAKVNDPKPEIKKDELDQIKKNAGVDNKSEYKNKLDIIKSKIVQDFFDPEAVKFKQLMLLDSNRILGLVNGKNRYGAYVGWKYFVYNIETNQIDIKDGVVNDIMIKGHSDTFDKSSWETKDGRKISVLYKE